MAGITKTIERLLWSRVSLVNGILAVPAAEVQHNFKRMVPVLISIQQHLDTRLLIYVSYISAETNVLNHWQLPVEFEDGRGVLFTCPDLGSTYILCTQLQNCRAAFERIMPLGHMGLGVIIPRVGEPAQRVIDKAPPVG